MTHTAIFVLAVSLASVSSAYAVVTNPANGHDYLLTPTEMSWQDAQSYARSLGGDLVTIRSQAENDWLMQTFWSARVSGSIWIGLTDEQIEGQWQWVSGEPVTFLNWYAGEPNNAPTSPTGEDYAVLYEVPENGQWNDYPSPYYTNLNTGQTGPLYEQGIVELVPSPDAVLLLAAATLGCSPRRRRGCACCSMTATP
jgi:hypothetical protein